MTSVYISGVGLVSSMGANLGEALRCLHNPPQPEQRSIRGLDFTVPYYAIPSIASYKATSWHERCETLICQAAAEAGNTSKTGGLYLASSSVNVGAIEAAENHANSLPEFLTQLGKMLDWQGPVFWINTACTSSLNAILAAETAIQAGLIQDALVIGLELENNLTLAGFAGMQLLAPEKARPFAARRNGLVLGEAVAAIGLSKQPSQWRIVGGAQVIDSSQVSGASTTAYQAMLQLTLDSATLATGQIDLIKVQAAGSVANDAIEAAALRNFFTGVPPLLSLKTFLGHTLGASGAAELALLLGIIEQQQWPNIALGVDTLDVSLGVNFAAELPLELQHILISNLGFGGSHTCIALEHMAQDIAQDSRA
ncbi:MAG: beta-ketoacyl synthase N-terminal-like domain-containing protein [Pseudomonadota bacterium]